MKTKLTLATFALIAATFFAAPAQAQVAADQRTANVPFAFQVGATTLPAGDYVFTLTGNTLQVRTMDGSTAAAAPFVRVQSKHASEATHLSFDRTGDDAVLQNIFFAGQEEGVQLITKVRAASRI